jgi:hydroxymethylpyrimidine/phosphomethylpyrimidine kinase
MRPDGSGAPRAARATVLVLSGLDPSGGAGVAADILAVAAQGAHALPLVTALTVQDNERVFSVVPVDADLLLRQARVLAARIRIDAVKIGIPGSGANAAAIAALVAELRREDPELPVVLDPVLASGHGDVLSADDALRALDCLLPLATLLLPNLPEAARLAGDGTVEEQARRLLRVGCGHVLITGGHADGEHVVNRCFGPDGERTWRWPRLAGAFHGSGCTLAAAAAARLALGESMDTALAQAQAYVHEALAGAYAIAPGQLMPRR